MRLRRPGALLKRAGFFNAGEIHLLEQVAVDISSALDRLHAHHQRGQTEKALQESEERFRTLYQDAVVGFYRTTPDGRILMVNAALLKMLGYSSFDELGQRNLEEDGFESDRPRHLFKEQIERDGFILGLETAWHRRDGSFLHVSENCRAVRDEAGRTLYYDGSVEDITARKQAEIELRDSLREKTELLKEVHHRVKNNLQVISSLLNLQASRSRTRPPWTRSAKLNPASGRWHCCTRLSIARAMSRASTARLTWPSVGAPPSRLRCRQRPHPPRPARRRSCTGDPDDAIPCGLIVNELIRSFKHAFPG